MWLIIISNPTLLVGLYEREEVQHKNGALFETSVFNIHSPHFDPMN